MELFSAMRDIITLKIFWKYILKGSEDSWDYFVKFIFFIIISLGLFLLIAWIVSEAQSDMVWREMKQREAKQREIFLNRTVVYNGDTLAIKKKIGDYVYILEEDYATPITNQTYRVVYECKTIPDSIYNKGYATALERKFSKTTKRETIVVTSRVSDYYDKWYGHNENSSKITYTNLYLEKLAKKEQKQLEEERRLKAIEDRENNINELTKTML